MCEGGLCACAHARVRKRVERAREDGESVRERKCVCESRLPISNAGRAVGEGLTPRETPEERGRWRKMRAKLWSEAIRSVVATLPNIQKLKPEQEQVLLSFLGVNDVVALLPTGFGKSFIFQLRQLAPLQ